MNAPVTSLPSANVLATDKPSRGDAFDAFIDDAIRAPSAMPSPVLERIEAQSQIDDALDYYSTEAKIARAQANRRFVTGLAVGALGALGVFGFVAVVRRLAA